MPLTDLMKKDTPFIWGEKEEVAFKTLKKIFREDVLLQHFDWDRPARLETDASDRGTGGVLLQPNSNGVWKPVAFFSRKMTPAESNYEIYDKELLAIVQAFEEWRPELEGSLDPVEVVTDNKDLEYFMNSRLLSRRQARWSEFLSRFNFKICYRPGTLNSLADPLSRPPGDPDPSIKKLLEQQLIKPHNISTEIKEIDLFSSETIESITGRIRKASPMNEEIMKVVEALDGRSTPAHKLSRLERDIKAYYGLFL